MKYLRIFLYCILTEIKFQLCRCVSVTPLLCAKLVSQRAFSGKAIPHVHRNSCHHFWAAVRNSDMSANEHPIKLPPCCAQHIQFALFEARLRKYWTIRHLNIDNSTFASTARKIVRCITRRAYTICPPFDNICRFRKSCCGVCWILPLIYRMKHVWNIGRIHLTSSYIASWINVTPEVVVCWSISACDYICSCTCCSTC